MKKNQVATHTPPTMNQVPFMHGLPTNLPQTYTVPYGMTNQQGYQPNYLMTNQHGYQPYYRPQGRQNRGRGGRGRSTHERKYCWTHGLQGHNGRECNSPMQGH